MNIKIATFQYRPKLCQVVPQQNHPAFPGHPLGFTSTVYEDQKSPVPKKKQILGAGFLSEQTKSRVLCRWEENKTRNKENLFMKQDTD